MRLFLVVEITIIILLLAVIWQSISRDHEGDWIQPETGERLTITARDHAWVATSKRRTLILTRACPFAPFRSALGRGWYARGAGVIRWPGETWVRFTTSPRNALNWLEARNLIWPCKMHGAWVGHTPDGDLIYLKIDQSSWIKVGAVREPLRFVTTPSGMRFENALHETFMFSWDGHTRAILTIHNGKVVMDRLDKCIY